MLKNYNLKQIILDRRYIRYFDWISFLIIVSLSLIGLALVFSATYKLEAPFSIFFKKQCIGIVSGFVLYCIVCLVDYRLLCQWGWYGFFATLCLLLFTLVKGSIGMGAQRWLNLGFFSFQPSELMKIFLPLSVSYVLFVSPNRQQHLSYTQLTTVVGMIALSALLIAKQPDLGTAIILILVGISLMWFGQFSSSFFVSLVLISILALPFTWHKMHVYQKQRVLVFLGVASNIQHNYQLEQSKIAFGSGGIWGKGFLKGTQNKLMFLPEGRTDFIFALAGEEFGLCGSLTIMLLFLMLFLRLLWIALQLTTHFCSTLFLGLLSSCIFCFIINSSMVLGLLPIVGIPLPFMSYGISHTWINFIMMGMLQGINIRRFYH